VTARAALSEYAYGPYFVCGWKVVSAMPLPELLPWRGDDRQPDVVVTTDHNIPAREEHWLTRDAQGTLQMVFKGVTLTVPQSGDRIHVHLEPETDPLEVRNYLYGSGLAALCYLHGILPLHGSAVRVGDQAVIFSGDSGAGKSTLATAMARHGHGLLSDDVCALEFLPNKSAMLRPAFPRVKLLADAIEGFSFERETVYTQSPRGTKGHFGMVPLEATEEIASLPVAAIYILSEPHGEEIQANSISGHESFQLVAAQVHRSGIGELLSLRQRTFGQLATLLSSVPVYALERPRDFNLLDRTVDFLEKQRGTMKAEFRGLLAV
jgi:hypothetical protein